MLTEEFDKTQTYDEAVAVIEEMIDEVGIQAVVNRLSKSAGVRLMLALEKRYFDE